MPLFLHDSGAAEVQSIRPARGGELPHSRTPSSRRTHPRTVGFAATNPKEQRGTKKPPSSWARAKVSEDDVDRDTAPLPQATQRSNSAGGDPPQLTYAREPRRQRRVPAGRSPRAVLCCCRHASRGGCTA